MKYPLVSVVMPVYNGEKFLKESIESILNQTYKNFEFIIVNDASTDNSEKIIKYYEKKDKRIKYFKNKKNLGQSESVKKGINFSKGKYFFKLDNDDIADKSRLKKIVDFFENNQEYIVVGSNIKIINEKSKVVGTRIYPKTDKDIRKCLFYKSPFAFPATGIRMKYLKKVIRKNKLIFKFKYANDYLLWYELLKLGKGLNFNDFLLSYRISEYQAKSKKTKEQLLETIEIQKIIFKQENNVPFLARLSNFLLHLLLLFPSKFIIYLFKKIEYKKSLN